MDEFEKVERLRSRASVTYEEAREALRQANGDLLDAIVILEKQGKTTEPAVSTYRTTYEEQEGYEKIEEEREDRQQARKAFSDNLKRFLKNVWVTLMEDSLCVIKKNGEEAFRMPLIVLLILLLMGVGAAVLLVMIVLLFFGIRYRIVGRDEMPNVNDILDRAGNMADNLKDEFTTSERK